MVGHVDNVTGEGKIELLGKYIQRLRMGKERSGLWRLRGAHSCGGEYRLGKGGI